MLRRLLVIVVLALAGLVVAPTGPAWACSCGGPEYTGDLVVVGVAESVHKPWSDDEVRVRLRVESVQRGDAGAEVELRTAADGPACGYTFHEGHRYLVYSTEGTTTTCDGNENLGLVDHPGEGPPGALWWSLGAGAVVVATLLLLRRRGRAQ
ncbi:hypothetical protein [Actinoplanes sp. NPDC049599]|uniref:hypothetical protein n=1 Tax=Actinoplanes sp. NPDC049599 TaxID=3363903 RepID=UPI0037ADDC21